MWGIFINLFVSISERIFLRWYDSAKDKQELTEALKRAKIAKDVRADPNPLSDDKLHLRD